MPTTAAAIPRFTFADGYSRYRGSSRVAGIWRVTTASIDPLQAQRKDMATFVDAGITTFDCADIYTGVESLIGGLSARVSDARPTAAGAHEIRAGSLRSAARRPPLR